MTSSKMCSRKVLENLALTISKEAHILQQFPNIFWQQLFNRLQWFDILINVILQRERSRRDANRSGFWLRLINPLNESNALIRTFKGHNNHINTCAFSPDRKRIISAGHGGEVRIWDLKSGCEVERIKGDFYHVYGCAFDPSGQYLTLCTKAKTVIVEIKTRKVVAELEHPTQPLRAEFHPKGEEILTVSADLMARVWEKVGTISHQESVYAATYTIEGDLLLVKLETEGVILYRPENGKYIILGGAPFDPLPWKEFYKPTWAFSNDRKFLAMLVDSGRGIGIWDTTDGSRIAYAKRQIYGLLACERTIYGPVVITTSGSTGQLNLWAPNENKILDMKGHTGRIGAGAFDQDGQLFLSCSWDWTVKLWRIAELEQKYETSEHDMTSLESIEWLPPIKDNPFSNAEYTFNPKGRSPITVREELMFCGLFGKESVRRFEVLYTETGLKVVTEGGHPFSPVSSISVSPDGAILASAGMDGFIHLWSLTDGRRLTTFPAMGRVKEILFSRSGCELRCRDEGGNTYFLAISGKLSPRV